MKRVLLLISSLISIFLLTACSSTILINHSYYSNYEAGLDNNSYNMSGKAYVVEKNHMLDLNPITDKTVTLSGKITDLSGNVQIVYITPDKENVVIVDSKEFKKKTFDIDTTFELKKGEGHLEFRGDNSSLQFELNFSDITSDIMKKVDEKTTEYEEPSSDKEAGDLLNNISVAYPKEDDSNVLLTTNLDDETNIKISTRVNVTGKDVKFGDLNVVYKTEYGKEYTVLEHKKNSVSWGEFEWQDNFEKELTLPAGKNELIVKKAKGKNYDLKFDIKVYKLD